MIHNNFRRPYPAIAEKVGGPILRRIVTVLINLSICGDSVPLLLLGKYGVRYIITNRTMII